MDDFASELQAIVDKVAPEYRARMQQEIDALLQAGARSREGLVAMLLDPGAGAQRAHACWVLGRLEADEALPAFLTTLQDQDASLRREAANALGSLGRASAVPALIEVMQTDPDEDTRMVSTIALGSIGALSSVDPLLAVLRDAGAPARVRGAAAEALIGPRDARVVPELMAALSDPAAEVRFWSAFALGQLGDAQVIPALRQLASDDAVVPEWWSVREEAEAAIASILGAD